MKKQQGLTSPSTPTSGQDIWIVNQYNDETPQLTNISNTANDSNKPYKQQVSVKRQFAYNKQFVDMQSRNFKEVESLTLPDSITSIDSCKDFIAVGCLDDSLHIWANDINGFKKDPLKSHSGNAMGIIDISFNHKSTLLAASCMDSTVRLFDLTAGKLEPTTIECDVMMNWKVEFVEDRIVTGGDSGTISSFDATSKEKLKQTRVGDAFLTSIARPSEKSYFAAGNNNGDVFVQNFVGDKILVVSFKAHHKLVRELTFIDSDTKILTASDDATIKVLDIPSEKITHTFEGHKISVSSVDLDQTDPRLFYTTSFDKTVKCWDLRDKSCIATMQADSPLWDCKSIGRNVFVGGESGKLNVYTLG